MPKCIYCLKDKDRKEFNTEHVVSQCFGTYTGQAAVLNHYEVCEECNTYFNKTFENVINLDSIETVERMRFGRPMKDGIRQLKQRTKVFIASGILEGIEVTPTVNNAADERMMLGYSNMIGIRKIQNEIKYDFFTIENIPELDEDRLKFIRENQYGIISFGYSPEEVENALNNKGWVIEAKSYEESGLSELLAKEKSYKVTTTDWNDSIKRRFAAKNVFNFLCYEKGRDFVLKKEFDPIRQYIRNGVWDQSLFFSFTFAPSKEIDLPNEHAHALAYLWCPDDGKNWSLYGTVTWYGKMTYNFKLCNTSILVSRLTSNILPSTEALYCDNEERKQTIDKKGIYVFRKSSGNLIVPFPYNISVGGDRI